MVLTRASQISGTAGFQRESGRPSKRLRMSFGAKKLGRSHNTDMTKPATVEEKAEDSDVKSSKIEGKSFEDSFLGTVQRIRTGYGEHIENSEEPVKS